MTTSKSSRSSSIERAGGLRDLDVSSGSLRTWPLGSTISGSLASGPACSSSPRPLPESAGQKACGIAQRWRMSRRSYARPAQVSPTTCTVCGEIRRAFVHSSRKLPDGLMEDLVRRRRGPEDVVVDLPHRHRLEDRLGRWLVPHARQGTSIARLACGCSGRTRASSSLPVVPVSHCAASTRATSSSRSDSRAERLERLVGRARADDLHSRGRSGRAAPARVAQRDAILLDG